MLARNFPLRRSDGFSPGSLRPSGRLRSSAAPRRDVAHAARWGRGRDSPGEGAGCLDAQGRVHGPRIHLSEGVWSTGCGRREKEQRGASCEAAASVVAVRGFIPRFRPRPAGAAEAPPAVVLELRGLGGVHRSSQNRTRRRRAFRTPPGCRAGSRVHTPAP